LDRLTPEWPQCRAVNLRGIALTHARVATAPSVNGFDLDRVIGSRLVVAAMSGGQLAGHWTGSRPSGYSAIGQWV